MFNIINKEKLMIQWWQSMCDVGGMLCMCKNSDCVGEDHESRWGLLVVGMPSSFIKWQKHITSHVDQHQLSHQKCGSI